MKGTKSIDAWGEAGKGSAPSTSRHMPRCGHFPTLDAASQHEVGGSNHLAFSQIALQKYLQRICTLIAHSAAITCAHLSSQP